MQPTPTPNRDFSNDQPPAVYGDSNARQDAATKSRLKQLSLEWLAEYGDDLYAYASRRVASSDLAEELVQEAFLGAIKSQQTFSGDVSPKTWLFSILRHKIADYYRQKSRVASLKQLASVSGDLEPGKPVERVAKAWSDPGSGISEVEFQNVLRECISELPDLVRQAFEYRFFDNMELDEICELQKVSPNNLSARMYRARIFLRKCLDYRWF